ncbi:hypothetical protein [Raoultella planticola]|uniref:hypothetical protein n=1 Tax=Raoultella planticola TaxID=575 RepID=UPI000B16C3FE|nr:hypothetical protein [Raoultella planticola]
MTTDITKLAQSLKAAAEHYQSVQGIARYSKTADAKERFLELANPANILSLVEALEKAQTQSSKWLEAYHKAVSIGARYEEHIAELESRTVKLPKPHAHLIWIQAGHAPDDYWDDVAVSHSEKDRCCDGSERYPVYAHWEIEEALTSAGIKWEAE